MDKVVYLTCGATSVLCAVLLLRAHFRSRARLLLWSGACFTLLAVANIFLYIDMVVISSIDFLLFRNLITLAGAAVLLCGLIWETVGE